MASSFGVRDTGQTRPLSKRATILRRAISMLNEKKIVVVMPAYNAALTLDRTYSELPLDIVDEVILVDDGSSDGTVALASKIGLTVFQHRQNLGYGRNQKT